MPIEFEVPEVPSGIALSSSSGGGTVRITTGEILGPEEPFLLANRLASLDQIILRHIDGFHPERAESLLVLVRPDRSAVAYANDELTLEMSGQGLEPGQEVNNLNLHQVTHVGFTGVTIPNDCGVICVLTHRWRRSLLWNFSATFAEAEAEAGLREPAASLALLLRKLGGATSWAAARRASGQLPVPAMEHGLDELRRLLVAGVSVEDEYQRLLEQHVWMLGPEYIDADRHIGLSEHDIPDFLARQAYNNQFDLVEIKHPFITLFRRDGKPGAGFNDAWNQAERYARFARDNRDYLFREKNLPFERAACVLLIGYRCTEAQQRFLTARSVESSLVTILTYDQLLTRATGLLELVRAGAGDSFRL